MVNRLVSKDLCRRQCCSETFVCDDISHAEIDQSLAVDPTQEVERLKRRFVLTTSIGCSGQDSRGLDGIISNLGVSCHCTTETHHMILKAMVNNGVRYFRPVIFPHFRVAKLSYCSFAASKPKLNGKTT